MALVVARGLTLLGFKAFDCVMGLPKTRTLLLAAADVETEDWLVLVDNEEEVEVPRG